MMIMKPMFVAENWHKSYGQALLEADPAKRAESIAVAEREILNRYLEPLFRVPPHENHDLINALDALSQLKKANVAA